MRPMPRCSLSSLGGPVAALLAAALLSWLSSAKGGEPGSEATLKIQFIHYVAQYAVWPTNVLSSTDRQFALGILGQNPFGEALETYFRQKSVKGRQFALKFFPSLDEESVDQIKTCHMLFVSSSEKSNFAQIIKTLE